MTEDESIEQKVKKLFSGQDELFDRIKPRKTSETVSAALKEFKNISVPLAAKAKKSTSRHATKVINGIRQRSKGKPANVQSLLSNKKITYIVQRTKSHPKAVAGMGAFLAASVFALLAINISKHPANPTAAKGSTNVNEVAGVQSKPPSNAKLTTDKPSFAVITPGGKSDVQGIERKTPEGDAVYTYVDSIEDSRIEVSEQKLPDTFAKDRDTKLADFAKASYLPSIIQIDGSQVYHGVNDKSGTQTLVFIGDGLLVFIKSPNKLSDDKWAGYISNLQLAL
jgi:hypothetical protein